MCISLRKLLCRALPPSRQAWLLRLAEEMKSTLQQLLVECVREGSSGDSSINPLLFPSQILCLTEQVSRGHAHSTHPLSHLVE